MDSPRTLATLGRPPDWRIALYPGTHAATTPDKAALIMADTGETVTYAELEERTIRLAHVLHDAGLRPGDSFALLAENGPRHHECYWAGAAQRALPHRAQHPPLRRGADLHRPRLRREGAHRLRRDGRPGGPDRGGGARDRGAAGVRWPRERTGRGLRRLRDGPRRRLGRALRRPAGRRRHALLLRHHRAPQGDPGVAARAPGRRARRPPGGGVRDDLLLRSPTPSTSPPRRSTTRRRCASAASCTRPAARW